VISFECAEIIVSAGLLSALCTSANSLLPPLLTRHRLGFIVTILSSDLLSEGHLAQSQACSMLEALVSVSEKVRSSSVSLTLSSVSSLLTPLVP
jgi:hypothetical protein